MGLAEQNSFMKSIFFGQIREDLIFPFPRLNAETTETVKMVLDSVEKFGKEKTFFVFIVS